MAKNHVGNSFKKWTLDDMDVIRTLWTSNTTQEIAEKLRTTEGTVYNMAARLRKAGIDIPRKRKTNYLESLVGEYVLRQKSRR